MTVRTLRSVWMARFWLVLAMLLVTVPLLYQVGISFKPVDEVFSSVLQPLPQQPTLENYQIVLQSMPIPQYLLNSLLFAVGVTVGQLLLALPAAYAFSYFNFRFKNLLLALVLLSLLVPFVITYIPNYLLLANYRLINTLPGLILPMLGISLGFGIFLLRQHFMSFQKEIMEAAMIDGATSWQTLTLIVAPANIAALTALSVYILINTWNQFIWPLLIGGGRVEAYTLTVGVQMYFTNPEGGNRWGSIMAASVLTSLPTILMYMVMRKGILQTFTEGAVKG